MRFNNYLNEDDIQKGLSVDEPEVGEKYPDELVKEKINIIEKALSMAKKQEANEANAAIIADLEDKLDKWKNVDKETKPAGPVIPAIDVLAATPPPEEPAAKEKK